MKKLGYFLLTLLILCAAPAIAQDQKEAPAKKLKTKKPAVKPQVKAEKKEEPKMDVVVTASKFEKPTEEIAKSVEVSKKKEIEAKGEQSLAEVAADQPGVITTRSGGEGGGTGIYIRGGNTDQVLVLVDGIEANEPMSYGRGSDPDVLAMPGVDQVEILEGPASALYGSDAEAGVINIITRRPPNGLAASLFLKEAATRLLRKWRAPASARLIILQTSPRAGSIPAGSAPRTLRTATPNMTATIIPAWRCASGPSPRTGWRWRP